MLPTDPGADYRVRIWTTGGELPFAGHPTLGSAHAWFEAGGRVQVDVVDGTTWVGGQTRTVVIGYRST